jgi:hypothetical protein
MSHNGPVGPAALSQRFTETFSSDDAIACKYYRGEVKLLLINYGTRGDRVAIDDLLTASANCERLQFKVINARDITPEMLRAHYDDSWGVVYNPGNSKFNHGGCVYDGNGQHFGWYGNPGCRGRSCTPIETPIHYQALDVSSDMIRVSNKEGSSVEYLGNVMTNCAYFDRPGEIHVVYPDNHKLVNATFELQRKVSEHFNGPVKLVTYAETLLTNQCWDRNIVYVAVAGSRQGHEYDYEQYRNCEMVWRKDGSAIWGRGANLPGKPSESFGDRMNRLGISGGFRRDEMIMFGALNSSRVPYMEVPPGASHTSISVSYPGSWCDIPVPQKKRPKGPITMPGLGERKKKGKHKTKW